MCATARTVYPGLPSRSAAQAVRTRSMTRFRLGAPPVANSRDRCSRVTRSARATSPVLIGAATRRLLGGAARDPFARDRMVHGFDEHARESRPLTRHYEGAVLRPKRRQGEY